MEFLFISMAALLPRQPGLLLVALLLLRTNLLLAVVQPFLLASLCAGHAQQLGGESPLPNLMGVKG